MDLTHNGCTPWAKVAHLSLSFPLPLHVLSGLTTVLLSLLWGPALPPTISLHLPTPWETVPLLGLPSRISFEQITSLLARPWMTQILGWSKSLLAFFCKMLWKGLNGVFGQPNIKHLLCAMELITQSCPWVLSSVVMEIKWRSWGINRHIFIVVLVAT